MQLRSSSPESGKTVSVGTVYIGIVADNKDTRQADQIRISMITKARVRRFTPVGIDDDVVVAEDDAIRVDTIHTNVVHHVRRIYSINRRNTI